MADQDHTPTHRDRFIIGVLGTLIIIGPPILSKVFAEDGATKAGEPVNTGMLIVLVIAGVLSVYLNYREPHVSRLSCLFSSMGLPAVIVSVAVGSQIPI